MRAVSILLKKELKENLTSPLYYILCGLFTFSVGVFFYMNLTNSHNLTTITLRDSVLRPIFGNMNLILLFITPILTMRALSSERRDGTLDILLLSKLTQFQIILSKFLSNLILIIFMLVPTLIFPIILSFSGLDDWALVFSNYFGLILTIACYVAIGIFASGLTENPVIAAVITFFFLIGMIILVMVGASTHNMIINSMFQYLSTPFHFEGFSRGMIKSYSLIYYMSFIGLFLYLGNTTLEKRKW